MPVHRDIDPVATGELDDQRTNLIDSVKQQVDGIVALKIWDCISRREFITAAGNYELQRFGAWQSNWFAVNNEIEQELVDLWRRVNGGPK